MNHEIAATTIWDQVSKSDPRYLRKMEHGPRLTAIDAYSQFRRATELFGPMGQGWGLKDVTDEWQTQKDVYMVHAVFWWRLWANPDIGGEFPIIGTADWFVGKARRLDRDAPVKALTHCLSKALSYLGFNADVFLGEFDDNRNVPPPPSVAAAPVGPDALSGGTDAHAYARTYWEPGVNDAIAPSPLPADGSHPAWFGEPLGFGKRTKLGDRLASEYTWGELATGAPNGIAARFLREVCAMAIPAGATASLNRRRVARAMAVLVWIHELRERGSVADDLAAGVPDAGPEWEEGPDADPLDSTPSFE